MLGVRVVLSGGTGALGRACVPSLVQAGHDVVALTRSSRGAAVVEAMGATPARGDVLDVDSLVRALDGADAVVNLATGAPSGTSPGSPARGAPTTGCAPPGCAASSRPPAAPVCAASSRRA